MAGFFMCPRRLPGFCSSGRDERMLETRTGMWRGRAAGQVFDWSNARGFLDLRTMWCPVSGKRCTAAVVPDLRRRAAVRELERPNLDRPRAVDETSQACLA